MFESKPFMVRPKRNAAQANVGHQIDHLSRFTIGTLTKQTHRLVITREMSLVNGTPNVPPVVLVCGHRAPCCSPDFTQPRSCIGLKTPAGTTGRSIRCKMAFLRVCLMTQDPALRPARLTLLHFMSPATARRVRRGNLPCPHGVPGEGRQEGPQPLPQVQGWLGGKTGSIVLRERIGGNPHWIV